MKKSVSIIILFLSLFAFNACKEKVVIPPPPVNEFTAALSEQDTIAMLKLCDDCMELLKGGDVDAVVAMLHEYDDSLKTVSPISDESAASFRRQMQVFPVRGYKRASYKFFEEGLNDVKYEVTFAEGERDRTAPKTFFMFNPVKVDGTWFLCVKQSDQRVNG